MLVGAHSSPAFAQQRPLVRPVRDLLARMERTRIWSSSQRGVRTAPCPGAAALSYHGCGFGDVARTLAREHHLDVTGIDIPDSNIAAAQRRAASKRALELVCEMAAMLACVSG